MWARRRPEIIEIMSILASLVLALPLAAATPDAPAAAPDFDPGPAVGQTLPPFELPDQDGRMRSFASLAGPEGLVLVFYRSADW